MMSAPPPSDVCEISQHVTSSKLSPALVVGLQCCLPAVGLADAHAAQVAAIAAGEQEGGKVGAAHCVNTATQTGATASTCVVLTACAVTLCST